MHDAAEAVVCEPALATCPAVRSWQLPQAVDPLRIAVTTRWSRDEWHVAHDRLAPSIVLRKCSIVSEARWHPAVAHRVLTVRCDASASMGCARGMFEYAESWQREQSPMVWPSGPGETAPWHAEHGAVWADVSCGVYDGRPSGAESPWHPVHSVMGCAPG